MFHDIYVIKASREEEITSAAVLPPINAEAGVAAPIEDIG